MKIDKKNTFINGQKADATLVNQNFDDLFSIVNGNIEADNIKNSSISLDKLSKKVSDKWLDPVANIAARDALTGLVAGTRVTVINDGFGNQVDYVYTGSAWVKISGTVAAQNYTEITGLTDQLKFKTLYANVIEYGAKGDGVQNESVYIQNAIDAVSASGGGTVFIPKGTYNINTTLRIKSYVKILCDADAVIKRAADISALVVNSTLAVTAYNGDKFWEIDGGIWDSAGATYPSEHTTIAFGHCQNVTIKNATFRNIKDAHFIEINSSNHAKVLNCVFTDYTGTTEQLQIDMAMDNVRFPWSEANGTPTTYDNTVCDEILISGNVFINGVRGVGSHSFVTGFTHKNIKIVDNHFENLSLEAIRGLNYEGVLIEGNSFKNCQMGVYIFNDNTTPLSGFRIISNRFKDINRDTNSRAIWLTNSGVSAIYSRNSNAIITGNIVDTAGRHGIDCGILDDSVISNNIVKNCSQAGIFVSASKNIVIEGNVAKGNNTSNTASRYDMTLGFFGVVTDSQNYQLTGNIAGQIGANMVTTLNMVNNNITTINLFTVAGVTRNGIPYPVLTGLSAVSAYSTAAQSVTANLNGTSVKVTFDAETYDNKSEFASSKFTASEAGFYQINVGIEVAPAASNRLVTKLYVNGVYKKLICDRLQNGDYVNAGGSATLKLNANDYVEVYFETGVTTSISNSAVYTFFDVTQMIRA